MKRLLKVAFVLLIGVLGIRQALEMRASLQWPSVEGQIISSRISESRYNTGPSQDRVRRCCKYQLQVRYRYEVDGLVLEGDRLRIRSNKTSVRAAAERELAQYPVGARVTVYYDPEQPDQAVLIRH